MGGGAALLAAATDFSIGSVATLAVARTRPSAATAAAAIAAPTLFVVGSEDRIVRPSTTRTLYAAVPAQARRVAITGGFHCGFIDRPAFRGVGCDSGTISRAQQLALVHALLGDWFDATLKGLPQAALPPGVTCEPP